ncbi:MAG: hypothetical protein QNJ55_04610 [Xenococcus sp. MO_188.B8]|nr:hypothetical protein [Xenococcus sp. MO_188.B8]
MTITTNRAEAVHKYFIETPKKPEIPDYSKHQRGMVLGGVLIAIGLILLLTGEPIAILLGVAGIYFGFRPLKKGFSEYSKTKKNYEKNYTNYKKEYDKAEPKPSDYQMDKWMDDDIEKIKEEALKRLDLKIDDLSAEILIIGGPATEIEEIKYKRGKDGLIRYSHFDIVILLLTEYHVAAYHCTYSREREKTLNYLTSEFPYKEITNLETQTQEYKLPANLFDDVDDDKEVPITSHEFTLATSGANIITVAYDFTPGKDFSAELKKIGEEQTIRALRKQLQNYKQKHER